MMKKIYISGKITDIENEVPELFKKAEYYLKSIGYEVVNPIDLPHNHDKSWESYMREDLIALLSCDAIYMLHNFLSSKGANIELKLAFDLNLDVIFGTAVDLTKKLEHIHEICPHCGTRECIESDSWYACID